MQSQHQDPGSPLLAILATLKAPFRRFVRWIFVLQFVFGSREPPRLFRSPQMMGLSSAPFAALVEANFLSRNWEWPHTSDGLVRGSVRRLCEGMVSTC